MAKEIKFNIKLLVDGKEQLVTATSDLKDLRNAVAGAQSDLQRMNDTLMNFNQKIQKLQNISGAVSQLASTFNGLTEESRSFGSAMNIANTMAGKGAGGFARMKAEVSELSKTLPIAREELANGLYQVISNGVPEGNWIEYLQKSARASIGGVADLGETVKVTSTIIKNYGLSWDKAGDVQDKIQLTAKNGVTSFEQLAGALPRVTSNAATLGVSIDELMASFATLTGVSGNTAEVSTQMAAIFTALVKPSSEAAKTAQQMGIEFDAASIKAAGGMQNFLSELDKSVKAYSRTSGKLEQEVYASLFGSAESLRAIGPLTGQLADTFAKNVEAMKSSAGTIDGAFETVASGGGAKLQMLKNSVSGVADTISDVLSPALPVLNFASQAGNSLVAVFALKKAMEELGLTFGIAKARVVGMNAASVVWNATSVRMSALTETVSASMRGAAVSAATLKLAIQGLLISTGVGVAIVALTEIISSFLAKSEETKTAADGAAESLKGMGAAADEVKSSYENALKSTFADLMGKYDKLKAGWKSLSGEQKKAGWIRENQGAFNELRLKIDSVSDAESIFNGKTDAVVEAFKQRAMAAAYAAKLTALYQKQIELLDKKQDVRKSIASDAKRGGRNAKEGDIVPESWRSERYGTVGRDGVWRFTKEGAERYNGTNTSGNKQVAAVDAELNALNRQIDSTQKQMGERLKASRRFVTADNPPPAATPKATPKAPPKATPTATDTATEPKTYVEKLQEQLTAAQKLKENSLTVEARVEADARVNDIQAAINEATKGKVSIEAEADPTYTVEGSDSDKRQSYANARQRAERIREDLETGVTSDKEAAKRQIEELNRQLSGMGLKPVEIHFKTATEELEDRLRAAQRELEDAATVEAKVKASAKAADLQREINEATVGRLTIAADVEPEYTERGSAADKRASYANAQSKAQRIQQDYEIGITGKAEAQREIEELNREIAGLDGNLKPLKLEADASGWDKALGEIKDGWGSLQGIGSGVQSITDALDGNASAWERLTGLMNGFVSVADGIRGIVNLFETLTAATAAHSAASATDATATTAETAASAANTAAKSGEAIASATASGAKLPFPLNLAAIAAGVAAVVAALSAVTGFATGGVIGGTSTTGDKKFARVNSGEMILNKFQQARLFGLINGSFQPPSFAERRVKPVETGLFAPVVEPAATVVNISLGVKARKMLEVLADEKKIARKSGRNF